MKPLRKPPKPSRRSERHLRNSRKALAAKKDTCGNFRNLPAAWKDISGTPARLSLQRKIPAGYSEVLSPFGNFLTVILLTSKCDCY
ncbi:hypothetical protein [Bergeyella porcorum]|uniref:hypothetical protein n=1 Tax=Bergeyella porcorum TaxID=1735111 RepID=UPI002E1E5907